VFLLDLPTGSISILSHHIQAKSVIVKHNNYHNPNTSTHISANSVTIKHNNYNNPNKLNHYQQANPVRKLPIHPACLLSEDSFPNNSAVNAFLHIAEDSYTEEFIPVIHPACLSSEDSFPNNSAVTAFLHIAEDSYMDEFIPVSLACLQVGDSRLDNNDIPPFVSFGRSYLYTSYSVN
jgi:hypothetical protein